MTDDSEEISKRPTDSAGSQQKDRLSDKVDLDPAKSVSGANTSAVLPLPGMVAIALYMLVLAAVVTFGVVSGHISRLFLILAPLFLTGSFGLLRMFRWAWALTLSAVFLLMTYNLWIFLEQKEGAGAIQGVLNLVFFMYLIRTDVRERLR